MNDDDALRAHSFTITTAAKCAEDGHAIRGAYLLEIERRDGELFAVTIPTTARVVELVRDLAPEFVDFCEIDGEGYPLPALLGDNATTLH